MNIIKLSLLFIMATIIFFLIDLGQFFLIGSMLVPLVFCMYCTALIYKTGCIPLGILAFLQCLEHFCFYNFFLLAFIYIIPLTALAFFFRKNLYPSIVHSIVIVLISALFQIYAIEGYFLSIPLTISYAITKITGILIVMASFSLTINIWGMQDNRAHS